MAGFSKKLGISPHDFRVIPGRTKIDYDPSKEDINRKKHKYSLESAAHLLEKWAFFVPDHFMTKGPYFEGGEYRNMHMGLDDSKNIVVMVTTMRPSETIRIISFRKASSLECAEFYKETGSTPPGQI